ncbi:E3 ubiquitin-protein ligase RNF14-like [Triticum dicoccoides]|uniref:E3 ubiquitin-protein ligase RNF14-like n=1 Tax=Triticum dicoccoides TaxID=85692 RepID=UPI00188E75F3|nr:E3 ubiquitin-protein ligase RNF14-like [Triticum dicoccoides]
MAADSVGTASSPPQLPHRDPSRDFSHEASSSSSSRAAGAQPVSCDGRAEEDVLDIDSPWVAAAAADSRLEEAAACLQPESEADEDEIRNNQERQEDELMALEAIYGDDLVEFRSKAGLRYFQICIRYDLHDDAQVCARLSSATEKAKYGGCPDDDHDTKEHDAGPDEFSYTCNFEYLPPLILTCLLPKSYPSKEPPYFTVTAKWMDGPDVSQLCEMLDTIWAELPGQEVIYQWVEWIRSSSLLNLWFDGKILLGQDIQSRRHNGDRRAISRSISLESVIPSMLSYSSKKRYQAFLEDLHMCKICLNQWKGSNFIKLPCQHLYCVKCMETLCKMHVKEGTLFQLVCPDTKCNTSSPHHLLKRLLSKEEFERWDRLALEKALDSMADVVYCQKCVVGCVEDEDNNAECPKCSFTFCGFRKELWHPGKQCLTPEQKLQRRRGSGRMTEREVAQELSNIRELYKDVRVCPKCRIAIAKSEGCNKMVCGNCGQFFCFRCGKAIRGYSHFTNCRLFESHDMTDLDRQIDELQFGNQMRNQLKPVGAMVRCPRCREMTFKDDEKYIFCMVCAASSCTMCKRIITDRRMKSGHWGSSECYSL